MAIAISPTSKHEITRSQLITPQNLEEFGKRLLWCSYQNRDLFIQASLCVNYSCHTQAFTESDFLGVLDGLIFSAMQDFATCWVEGNPWPQNKTEWAAALVRHFNHFFSKHPEYSDGPYRMAALQEITAPHMVAPGDHDLICDGLVDYVRGVRYQKILPELPALSPSERAALIRESEESIRIPGATVEYQTSAQIMEMLFAAADPVKPFATGVATFDHLYANRATAGESWLAYGHPGGGKTNFACQAAGHTAALASGKLVMYVTTEMTKPIIMLRACSAQTSVPYEILKSLINSQGNHPQAEMFRQWVTTIGARIGVMDYREVSGTNYKEKFKRMLDTFTKAQGAPPDLIIWDWIGKALDAGFENSWQKREAYNGVAAMMVDTAKDLKNATITLAQAHKDTHNRTNLTEKDTADSRSLCDGMTGVMGITSLMETADTNAGDKDCHRMQQYFVICKCREQQTMRLEVLRRFDMARFDCAR